MNHKDILDLVLAQLDRVKGPDKAGWHTALCVFHDDHHPSLRVNGHGFRCFACGASGSTTELARKLGVIEEAEPAPQGLDLETLAAVKGLDPQRLRDLGVVDGTVGNGIARRPCVDIPYLSERGEVVSVQKRLSLAREPRFIWRRGDKAIAYGLWLLKHAKDKRYVILVEGASDCWAAWSNDIPCLGLPGASTWRSDYAKLLEGLSVYAWCEPGEAGQGFVRSIGKDIPHAKVIDAPSDAKDLADLFVIAPDQFHARIDLLIASAQPFERRSDSERGQRSGEAYQAAKHLIEAPDLIERVKQAIKDSGFAGDPRPALIAYVGLTSRLLRTPIHLAFIALSASGKNAAVDAVLPLFPESAFYLVRASSPRALIYSDEQFAYRAVVLTEADSLPEDGPAASAIRSLMSDGVMVYDVVERDSKGVSSVRRIVKPGPTGLTTTSTKPLGAQASTRTLTVSVSDSAEQTRQVLHAHADRYEGVVSNIDPVAWIAMQEWLALNGPWQVIVPFAHALADAMPTSAVRMRRDFAQLLTVVQVCALLRQHHRQRDDSGRLIAQAEDYVDARWLLEDIFATTVHEGLTPTIRQTVEDALSIHSETGSPVTEAELVEKTKVARTTIRYRIQRAIDGGWLRNAAPKGRSAQLLPGSALPGEQTLPDAAVAALCVDIPQNDSSIRQQAASMASLPGGSTPATIRQAFVTDSSDELVTNGDSSAGSRPPSHGDEIDEPDEPNLDAVTHKGQSMPWDGLLGASDADDD